MIKFGTGGWRAVIADEFTKENIRLVTAGLCRLMELEGHGGAAVCVGYDRRFLSKESAHWASEVLAGYGYKPLVVNRSAPTPLIMFTVRQMELPYGMAITASHNPAIYNGIKVFTAGGRDADQTVTGKIEEQIAQLRPEDVRSLDYDQALAQGIIREVYPFNEYIDSILQFVDAQKIKSARLRVAIDPMYGVSQSCLRTILLTCRCDVDVIHEQHDTLFGGRMPAPSAEALQPLAQYVKDNHCHLGIATDGDADRLGVIDEKGNYLHPNTLLVLLYYYLLRYRGWTGPCVRNNSTTHLLDRMAADMGEACYEVPVGFKHISAKMVETGAVIGGESSGGMAVRGHIKGKDGIYASALLVEMIAVTGMKLSEIMETIRKEFGGMALEERDYRFSPQKKEAIQKQLLQDKELPHIPYEVEKVSYLDGLKIYLKDGGWISVRFSGTEPLLRIFCEMKEKQDAAAFCKVFEDYLGL